MRNSKMWFQNRSDTNRAVEAQNMARGEETREIALSVSKNKGADQLRKYCEAVLRLCFRLCNVFSHHQNSYMIIYESYIRAHVHSKYGIKYTTISTRFPIHISFLWCEFHVMTSTIIFKVPTFFCSVIELYSETIVLGLADLIAVLLGTGKSTI